MQPGEIVMTDRLGDELSRLKSYDWRPVIPILLLIALYILFMPTYPTSFSALELHQKLIGLSWVPTAILSVCWFVWENELD